MPCRTHPAVNGVNTCNQCGEWLCEDCTVEINGRIFCRGCLAKPTEKITPRPASAVGPRYISGTLLFLFSLMPSGVNYMFMGLIKRGLAALTGFFLLIYLIAISRAWPLALIFGFSIPVYWITCFFDGFNIRRRINAGEVVSDDINDIMYFVKRNKGLLITFVGLLLVTALAYSMFSLMPAFFGRGLPVLVVLLGVYMLFRRPEKNKED